MLATTLRIITFVYIVRVVLAKCPIGTTLGPSNTQCFLYRTSSASWLAAEQDCVNRKGHLTSVHDTLTNKFLSTPAGGCANELWLGRESFVQETWSWTDGTLWQYTDWPSDHQSATGPQCLMLNSTDALWYGESCIVQKPYICKIPPSLEAHSTTAGPSVTCPAPKPLCLEGWTHSPVSNKCYKSVGVVSPSYQSALTACANLGASLPSIHSDTENAWFSTFAMINGVRDWIVLGLTRENGSAWTWSDGSAVDYTYWATNQTGDGHNYAQLYSDFNPIGSVSLGMWLAWIAGGSGGYLICQLPHL